MSSTSWNMKTFMKGASILTISAIIVKLLGAVYRVPFQNLVGDKGFYIYQQVYPFIGIFIVWTSYGFAVAVSKLLAESKSYGQSRAKMRIAFIYLLLLSISFFILLTVFAPFFARSMGDPGLVSLLRAGAYIVLLMPALAVLKGSFQSEGRMVPVAVSGVGEQAFRVVVILLGTWIAIRAGASLYTAGEIAMWGAVVGEFAGVVILALYFQRTFKGPLEQVDTWPVVKELTIISLSVSASSLILLLFQLVDSFTVFQILLSNGFLEETAMETKGVYDRGQPLVQMGILIASTLSLAIVPLIAHHTTKNKGKGALPFIRLTFRTAFLFGWAAAAGLALVLPFVNEMLFETRTGSMALIIFAVQIFWLSLILPLTAMLQGAGKVKVPALLLIGGLIVKIISNLILIPLYDINGAAIAGNIGFALITLGLVLYFKKVWPIRIAPVRFYGWVIAATVLMIMVVLPWMVLADSFIFDELPSRLGSTIIALTSVAMGAVVFLLVVMKSRIMGEREWYLLPFGKRLATLQLLLTKRKGE
ncbi:polysaccharide biosynthesis protein [Sporosarcina sp. Marseille-Q4063]|uniref:putative polysaccharide biosynthesis protein n=1 Tax=Sporosarcina sp. Marseille-Q4063 TaxID=2810514 RepID=UPI001BAEA217|nr:polysaccharide biosynthesis protein [Sporosarcina sp. Marseille-Q4063]QUW20695.1 polysaccharide biosynthesis protein [Sporosarcina sp. Marseille-Q4063]